MATVSPRDGCRLCGGRRLQLALRLAPTPLGDDFVPGDRCREAQESYALDLLLCADCANVQSHHVVSPDVIYRNYKYTTSVSLGLTEHFHGYAEEVIRRAGPPPDALVLEIGSNEGAMLRAFQKHALRVLGVDPAGEIAARATAAGVETLPKYFTGELARTIRRERGPAAVVIANNVLANIDDLTDVAQGIRTALAPDGVLVLETSYSLDVVEKQLVDTIFHEHLSYFSVRPLAAFCARQGLELIDAACVPTKGGSLRATVQLRGGPRSVSPSVARQICLEEQAGLHRPETWHALGHRLEGRKAELLGNLRAWQAQSRQIAAYGAAVGLTTMIYQFGLGEFLSFLVDDNPEKQGLFSPGLHLPTLPSESLYRHNPEYVVVLAWRYFEPIVRRHQAYLAQGGRFVLPLPEVRVIEASQ